MQNKLNSTARNVWRYYFGSATEGHDCFGIKIKKSAYGDENSSFGWTIDHTYPLNPNSKDGNIGADLIENMQPMSIIANRQKANDLYGTIKVKYPDSRLECEFSVEDNFFFHKKSRERIGILKVKIKSSIYSRRNYYYEPIYGEYYVYDGFLYKKEYDAWSRKMILQKSMIDFNAADGNLINLNGWEKLNTDEFDNLMDDSRWDD